MQEVAEGQAESIIETEVKGEVSRFKQETASQMEGFNAYLDELRVRYENDYKSLSKELAVLQQRNEIARLGDLGTQAADRSAFEKLERLKEEASDDSIGFAAQAEIARVKSFWANTTRVAGQNFVRPDGTIVKEADISTVDLMDMLLHHQKWNARALAAKALAKRKETGVPDALLLSNRQDQDLEVVRWTVDSFARVTGYEKRDVFSFDAMADWWADHAEEVNKTLTDPNVAPQAQ